uniref:Fibrinogen C-terminal domain-containing protein n=1 Tax=Anopheles farauti TaxID=69004 RepID=A0A182QAZ2_9DIPT
MNTSKVHLTDGDEPLVKYTGVYTVAYNASSAFSVYRDDAHYSEYGANWTVFQRRFDGSVDFNRNWSAYDNGFGDVEGEHWLGLAKLYHILSTERHELLIELEPFDGDIVYAKYDDFGIKNADERYEIKIIGKYSGTAGDSLQYHLRRKFATVDKEGAHRKCAKEFSGGGWFAYCFHMHLNGFYRQRDSMKQCGISWLSFKDSYSFKASKMMVRPYSYRTKLRLLLRFSKGIAPKRLSTQNKASDGRSKTSSKQLFASNHRAASAKNKK